MDRYKDVAAVGVGNVDPSLQIVGQGHLAVAGQILFIGVDLRVAGSRRRDLDTGLLKQIAQAQHHAQVDLFFHEQRSIGIGMRRAYLCSTVARIEGDHRIAAEAIGQIRAWQIAWPRERLRRAGLELPDPIVDQPHISLTA